MIYYQQTHKTSIMRLLAKLPADTQPYLTTLRVLGTLSFAPLCVAALCMIYKCILWCNNKYNKIMTQNRNRQPRYQHTQTNDLTHQEPTAIVKVRRTTHKT